MGEAEIIEALADLTLEGLQAVDEALHAFLDAKAKDKADAEAAQIKAATDASDAAVDAVFAAEERKTKP